MLLPAKINNLNKSKLKTANKMILTDQFKIFSFAVFAD